MQLRKFEISSPLPLNQVYRDGANQSENDCSTQGICSKNLGLLNISEKRHLLQVGALTQWQKQELEVLEACVAAIELSRKARRQGPQDKGDRAPPVKQYSCFCSFAVQ